MKKNWWHKKNKYWLILIILFVALLIWWLIPKQNKEEANFEPLQVSTADLTLKVSASGTISAYRQVEVKSKASGNILKLLAKEGDVVKTGQLLLVLDKTTELSLVNQCKATVYSAEANKEQAEESLKTAKRNLDQQATLLKSKFTTKEAFLLAESAYNLAKAMAKTKEAALIIAKEQLKTEMIRFADTEIRSPINGVILQQLIEEGQIISSGISSTTGGTSLFIVGDISKLLAKVDMDEVDISKIHLGQEVNVLVDAYQNRKFSGLITHIAPQAVTKSNVTVFSIEVTIVDKDRNLLKPGMTTTCEIIVANAKNAQALPNQAIYFEKNQSFVYVKENGKIVLKPIKIGIETDDETQILSGLTNNETVYIRKSSNSRNERRSGNGNRRGGNSSNSSMRMMRSLGR